MDLDLADLPSPEWWRAMQWFEDGDASVVAQLILSGEPMQRLVREFLADIVTGKLRPGRTDHARKILNADHKELLRIWGRNIVALGDAAPPNLRQLLKRQAIAEVARLSGASLGTVQQAWKDVNRRWAQLPKRRRAAAHRERLLTLRRKNDPFGR